jgi:hypothetical protein
MRRRADLTLVKALARAFRCQKLLDEGRNGSISEMAAAERGWRRLHHLGAERRRAITESAGLRIGQPGSTAARRTAHPCRRSLKPMPGGHSQADCHTAGAALGEHMRPAAAFSVVPATGRPPWSRHGERNG